MNRACHYLLFNFSLPPPTCNSHLTLAGIHAREWISPAVVMYMVRELTERADANADLVDNLDWYVVPSVNPDGYVFSHEVDRLWRKTRTPNEGSECFGTDANRNFDFQWATIGSSDDPCSQTFHGPSAHSEVETRNIRDYVVPIKDSLSYFIDVHSYSQLVIMPWGYTDEPPADFDVMYDVFSRANEALFAEHGAYYEVGQAHDTIYPTSGSARDWGKGVAEVKYTTGMELRDTGEYGFLLPEDQIIPNSEEVWAFHKSVARDIIAESRN